MSLPWQHCATLVKASEMFSRIRKSQQRRLKRELAELSGIDDFDVDETKGPYRGSNAIVHCVSRKPPADGGKAPRGNFALKRMYAQNFSGMLGYKLEMQIPLDMDHPNVMGVFKSFDDRIILPSTFEEEFIKGAKSGSFSGLPEDHDFGIASYGLLSWMDGDTVKKWYKDGKRLNAFQVGAIAMQIIDGLYYIHRRGYCFNDLKDDNVMFVKPPHVWQDGADLGTAALNETVPPVNIVDLGEAYIGLDHFQDVARGTWFPGVSVLAPGVGMDVPPRPDDDHDERYGPLRPVMIPSAAAKAAASGAAADAPPVPPSPGRRDSDSSSTSSYAAGGGFVFVDPAGDPADPSSIYAEQEAAGNGRIAMRVKSGAKVTEGPEIACHKSRQPLFFDGAKCDMWALGRLIVTMTTEEGERYPQKRGVDKYRGLASHPTPPTRAEIDAARPQLPRAFASLQPLVDSLLAWEPTDRCDTTAALDLCAEAMWNVPVAPGPARDSRIQELAGVMIKMYRSTKQLVQKIKKDGTQKPVMKHLWRIMMGLRKEEFEDVKAEERAWRVPLSTFGGADEGDVLLLSFLASCYKRTGAHVKPVRT